jgi:hypothetical protein
MKRVASVGMWIANIVGLLLLLTVANDGYAAPRQVIVQHAPIICADAAAE